MSRKLVYDFEWDIAKAITNVAKHDITFDQAATVFLDALALTVYDAAHSQSEDRWFTLGQAAGGGLLAITHTFHETPAGARIRIISARAATQRERRYYEDEPR